MSQGASNPASCDIAAGSEHIVVVANTEYVVYDYCGTALASGDLGDLTNFNVELFSPKVLFDEFDQRWIIVFGARDTNTQQAWIRGVFSTGLLPPGLGAYNWYDYDWTNAGGYWGDEPDVGYDPDGVYITTNDFNWASPPVFQRARITALDKQEIYSGQFSVRDDWFSPTNPGDGSLAFGIRAAEMKSDPGEYYLVSAKPNGASFLSWFEITGEPQNNNQMLFSFSISCGFYAAPPNMLQGDNTYAECGDARLTSAKYRADRLWTTQAQEVNFGGGGAESGIEVYVINTISRTVLQESGGLGQQDQFYCYPALDFDAFNRGVVAFLRGGPSVFPEARYVDYTFGGGFSASSLLIAGTDWKADVDHAGTNGDPYALGHYNGCDLGSNQSPTLWFHAQRAITGGDWDTQVGAICYDGAGILDVVPASGSFHSTGAAGGPFTPSERTFTLTNNGGARMYWEVVDLDVWQVASQSNGFLNPGGFVDVTISIASFASVLGVGEYADTFFFNDCMSGASNPREAMLTIGTDEWCPGSVVDTAPPEADPPSIGSGGRIARHIRHSASRLHTLRDRDAR